MREPVYPNVLCDLHPEINEPGYLCCKHIINNCAFAFSVELATEKSLGIMMCVDCAKRPPEMTQENFILACAQCCRNNELIE